MTPFEHTVAWMQAHHQTGNLTEAAIVRIMEDEFMVIRQPNEYLLSDYAIIDVMESFGITDTELFEYSTTAGCSAQCFRGPELEEVLRQTAQQYRAAGQHGMADLTDWCNGGIFLHTATLLMDIQLLFPDGVHEQDVRRIVRRGLGHERQHALQSMAFIMEGREPFNAAHMRPDVDTLTDDLAVRYAALPSEMEADAAGFQLMLDYE